jgi:ADP-heptose:LPS heptosyltransferase
MHRDTGRPLPPGARAAIISFDALGNYVVATPLIQMLAQKGIEVHYFGGTRIAEFADNEPLVARHYPLFGSPLGAFSSEGPFDLVVNFENTAYAQVTAAQLAGENTLVVGPAVRPDGREPLPWPDTDLGRLAADPDWTAPDLTAKYPVLQSGFIGEIFCRLTGLDGPIPAPRVPLQPTASPADVIVTATAKTPDKLWSAENWVDLTDHLKSKGKTVGVVGAKPSEQGKFWTGGDAEAAMIAAGALDLRGLYTLPQVAGVLASALRVVALDNGLLHMAAAVGAQSVGLYRHGIHRLWAPAVPNLKVLEPGPERDVDQIPLADVVKAVNL